jgi:SAM-dependent methyltransferase
MAEWFEDESFWKATYPFFFNEDTFSQAEQQCDKIIELTGVGQGRVLDLCCGPGRFSLPLAERGFEVTGVDKSAFLLDKADELALSRGLDVEWIQRDMRDYIRPDHFDLIINMWTSFGYFGDRQEDRRVLDNLHKNLKPGGRLIIDTISKEILARIHEPTMTTQLPDGSLIIHRTEVIDSWTRVRSQWMVIRDDHVDRFTISHTIYSGLELRDLLEQAGFIEVTQYGGLDGKEYGLEAERLVAVARK